MGVRRPGLVLAAAIAVSLPMIPSFLDGAIGIAAATVRFAIALALCWATGAVIEGVYDTYARRAREAEIDKALHDARVGQEDPTTEGTPLPAFRARSNGVRPEARNAGGRAVDRP